MGVIFCIGRALAVSLDLDLVLLLHLNKDSFQSAIRLRTYPS